ncbi:MAG: dTDP-glucose 4,6-dehydratase [Candidatus Kaelpia imicola]|nr:dTDP-glucose 4,6-dehydratase [Candidatus Kaelpia imicola]
MRKKLHKVLITGGAGFIGSEFVRLLAGRRYEIIVVDKLTYAGDLERLKTLEEKYKFYKLDICDRYGIEKIFKQERPDIVVHFAAQTHVDRSIKDAAVFIETNIKGTQNLLDAAKKYRIKKFIHISTDEVYGEIKKGKFNEDSHLQPGNPYAASKAAADLLIKSYIRTYDFPAVIVRPCNNYGPWQYPEKLVPLTIVKLLDNKQVPIYGKGVNKREWLYVADCAGGILKIMESGKPGEIYNLGSGIEKMNLNLAKKIIKILGSSEHLIKFVTDRPGHDLRYCLDSTKINKLGWKPKTSFDEGINQTVLWYKENSQWLETKIEYLRKYWRDAYRKK